MSGLELLHGKRVRALGWGPSEAIDDNETVPPGTEGTVTSTSQSADQVWVSWDNGARLALILGVDSFEVLD